jgi:hypothetical protein
MRRLLVAVGSVAALVAAGVLAAGVGARTVEKQSAISRPARPVLPAGSPCYVSIPRCSQRPCIVFIGSAEAAVSVPTSAAPAVAPSRSSKRCARMHGPRTSVIVNKASPTRPAPGLAIGPALTARLPVLAHQLAIRHP